MLTTLTLWTMVTLLGTTLFGLPALHFVDRRGR
jgi:hypothetical protein